MVLAQAAARAPGVLPVAGRVVGRVASWMRNNKTTTLVGAALTAEQIEDMIRAEAPNSDEKAIEETAHTVLRMLGADSEVLWPTKQRGEDRGELIEPIYFTMHLPSGRAWFSERYHSRKSVNAAFNRGRERPKTVSRKNTVNR